MVSVGDSQRRGRRETRSRRHQGRAGSLHESRTRSPGDANGTPFRMTPEKNPPEMTVKAVGLGLFLALVFGAANAYLGMKAGQTVAATIPAAVIAMALFRLPAFRGTLLEQNIARTAASVGEALVAGAIFTIPAFMLVDLNGVRIWTG